MFDIEKIKKNINLFPEEKLCEMIVTCRYFKISNDIIVLCMTELAQKRANGSNFKYELKIEELSKDLPELQMQMPDIREMLIKAVK
jgi:hypothetical protein